MALQDQHPVFGVTAQFAQLLLDHRDELDDYREELRQLAYWIVREDFDRQRVNRRLAEYATTWPIRAANEIYNGRLLPIKS